jgi:hypothetical protein
MSDHPVDRQAATPHTLAIYRDVAQKAGHVIAYRCPDCDARGQIKTPKRAVALDLFAIVTQGHREQVANDV